MSRPSASLEPAIIVIFGITGDLSQRYLLPSLYHLIKDGLLHEKTEILGITRGNTTSQELFERVELCVNEIDKICDPAALKAMHDHTTMFQMDLNDPSSYSALAEKLNSVEQANGICMNRLYYLSIPPSAYKPVVKLMGEARLNESCQHNQAATRLLVEKPFGFDLSSAQDLITQTSQHFNEEQIFRIDHYMAKETVQNILTFRFKNPIFEATLNNTQVSSIEIIAKEKIGIEGRADFYEPLGALRDFVQSHLIQILGIITMDKPASLDSKNIHKCRQEALAKIEPVPADKINQRVQRGQYKGYKEEVKNQDSVTETFVSMTVYSRSQRWQNVPIRLMTGKALDERKTEVRIIFHESASTESNELRFRIQPNEGIELDLATKKPGYTGEVQATALEFSYKNSFNNTGHPDAYERVLIDAVRGDHTLFATSEEVLSSWRILQPVLDAWSKSSGDLELYEPGSAGPSARKA